LKLTTQEKLQVSSYKLQINDDKEKSIQYIDSEGRSHIVWYEDEESAAIKTEYLQSVGIGKVSYWAQGYF
jgi:spore germination protein YaaH